MKILKIYELWMSLISFDFKFFDFIFAYLYTYFTLFEVCMCVTYLCVPNGILIY